MVLKSVGRTGRGYFSRGEGIGDDGHLVQFLPRACPFVLLLLERLLGVHSCLNPPHSTCCHGEGQI